MKIRYLLKRKGKKGFAHPIYIALYKNDLTELIYTKERCTLKDWNETERAPRDHSGETFTRIEKVKAAVLKVLRQMEANDREVTPFSLKQEFTLSQRNQADKQNDKDKKDKTNLATISSLIERWIKEGLGNYQPSTRRTVVTSILQFKEYLKISGQPKLERKDLTSEIISAYAEYLQVKRKLVDSTHGKRMKHLRWFLKWIKFDSNEIREIKIRTGAKNIIALSADELTRLENVDVSFDRDFQKSKDMFLLGCYSGLRISDLKRINEHRIKDREIHLTLIKNKKEVSIPMLAQTESILMRYGMSAPKISEPQLNKAIKDVCRLAGITKTEFYKTKVAGTLIEKAYPKCELVTSHSAGKTFITLAPDKWGLTPADVAAIVGKDLKTLLGYYLKPDLDAAKKKILEAEQRAQMKIA